MVLIKSSGGDTSSPEDDSTLKDNIWSATGSVHESTSDLSTSSSGKHIRNRKGLY